MTTGQPAAAGVRAEWPELPGHVHDWVGTLLGSPVTSAVNQPGGFSPGVAARVRCADGSRAFVKAVGTPLNPEAPDWHRAEARFAAALPDSARAPRLRGSYDDGEWVALVFDEIDGHAPEMPWRTDDLEHVLQAITELSTAVTPCPLDDAPNATDRLRQDLTAYPRLATAPPEDLDDWERRHLRELAELAEGTLAHIDGNTLVHFDIRADNIVLGNDGRVWFVDWPWACQGAIWLDTTLFLVNAALYGHDPQAYAGRHPLLADVDPWHVTGLLTGLAGMWAEETRQPAPLGIPTLRAFQRAQLDVTLAWIRRRTGWE